MVFNYVCDTVHTFTCNNGNPPPYNVGFIFKENLFNYSLTDTFFIKADFGDGTNQTKACYYNPNLGGTLEMNNGQLEIHNHFNHYYLSSGIFDVTYYISDQYGNADTLFHPAEVYLNSNCAPIVTRIFVDNNSNCVFDAGDSAISNVSYSISNGISPFYTPNSYLFNESIGAPLGVNFTATVDPLPIQQLGYNLVCPASGMINFTHNGPDTLNFAVNCNSNYDLSIHSGVSFNFKLGNSIFAVVGIRDISCVPMSGTYTLNLDPQLSFVNSLNAPTSGSGSTYTWSFSNLLTVGNGLGAASNIMYFNMDPSVQIGDILCYSFSVSPVAGDIDPSNNAGNLCRTVVSAVDPNFKTVDPVGAGATGAIAPNIKLTYTIGFQNTGTATADHVYVMDTLSADLDISTLQVLYSTYPMQLYIIDGHILKFDFVNIQLPDSGANEMMSHGFFAYEIDQNPNLSNGTQIQNTAAIYFDYNAPVITNTTLNTINTALGVKEVHSLKTSVYPNPFTDMFTIDFDKEFDGTIQLLDLSGRSMFNQQFHGMNYSFYQEQLSSGIYFLMMKDAEGIILDQKKLIKR